LFIINHIRMLSKLNYFIQGWIEQTKIHERE
jgi:hypothetical protein